MAVWTLLLPAYCRLICNITTRYGAVFYIERCPNIGLGQFRENNCCPCSYGVAAYVRCVKVQCNKNKADIVLKGCSKIIAHTDHQMYYSTRPIEIRFFVKLKVKEALAVGIKYSMHDIICDVNHCYPQHAALLDIA